MPKAEGISQLLYGENEGLFVSGKMVANNPYLSFEWSHGGEKYFVQTQLIGGYNLMNALVAASIGTKFLFITALPPVVENVSSTNDSSLSEHILLMFSDRTPSFLLKSPVRAAYAPLIALDFPPPLGPVIAVMPSRKVQSSS